MAPGQEVDRVSAKVVLLPSGRETGPVSVDLTRDPHAQASAGPAYNMDFTDSRGTPIKVSTYVAGSCGGISNKMAILVRTLRGETVTIYISRNDFIGDLKTKISNKTNIVQGDYWLDFQGKPLDDNYTLKYYSLTDNSHVTMRGRLKGG